MSGFRLQRADAALLVVDVQEKLAAAMPKAELERMLQRTCALIEGAHALGLPIVVTEQYPKGLGRTVSVLRERLTGLVPVEKLRFSAVDERVRAHVDEEISLGDFVMTGGEVAAMAIVDACIRLLPVVLGN